VHRERPDAHPLPPFTRRSLIAAGALGAWACAGPRPPKPAPTDEAEKLLSALTDQRASVAPITAGDRASRRARCGKLLAELGLDALLLESGTTLQWLTDVSWGHSERLFALAVLADGSHFWIVPAFEADRARLSIERQGGPGGEIVAWDEDEYPYKPLAAALVKRGAQRVAIEPALRWGFVDRFAALFGREKLASGQELLVRLRGEKAPAELAILRRASELTQLAVRTVARCVRPGMKGRDVGALMERAHTRLGMTGSWCLPLVGSAAAMPHGDASDEPLREGALILVDTGATLHGYESDTTRTWVFDGQPTAEIERAWNAVRDAQQRAFETIKPEAQCRAVDRAARALFVERGYAGGYHDFTHRLGHGIGMEGHEDPYFDSGSEVVLRPGMTFSDEPGLYFPGKFGVRLEDIVQVTETGADHFGTWQRAIGSPD
jgi:Xaa-Pro dipeptidase